MMMSYQSIRNLIMKNDELFKVARFFFTPIRVTKEYFARRKMADEIMAKYVDISKADNKIFYFGIPEHNNLGDIAQTYCTKKWINENYPNHTLIEARTRATFDHKFNLFMKEVINQDDIIFFQSGYCTRYKNPDHLMHLHIANQFPSNKLVVLPQTVKLVNKQDINKTRDIFSKCKRLCFITRDTVSYGFAESFVDKHKLTCFPDIVTSLIGRVKTQSSRSGVLLCVRNDGEKYYSDSQLDGLLCELKRLFVTVDKTDTNSDKTAKEVFDNLEEEVFDKINQFARYECVITDRYHGTIFSLIANTPVIVIKTNDHKVTSALEWFKERYDRRAVNLANSLEEAVEIARMIKGENVTISNGDSLYKDYYEHGLKEIVDNL